MRVDTGRPPVQVAGPGGLAQHGDLRDVASWGCGNTSGGTSDDKGRKSDRRANSQVSGVRAQ